MDIILEWLPLIALIGGLIVGLVGSIVAIPAIVFPPLEAVALTMAFGGFGVAILVGYNIYSQRQLEEAQTRYLEEYQEYANRWDIYREAVGRAERDAVDLGMQRIRAVYALLDSTTEGILSETQAVSIRNAYGEVLDLIQVPLDAPLGHFDLHVDLEPIRLQVRQHDAERRSRQPLREKTM